MTGVQLGRGQGGVAEKFLHDAQIRAALQEMGGSAVAQTVRPDVWGAADGADGLVHNRAGLAGPSRRPRVAEQQWAGPIRGSPRPGRPSSSQSVTAARWRPAERDRALFVALPSTR